MLKTLISGLLAVGVMSHAVNAKAEIIPLRCEASTDNLLNAEQGVALRALAEVVASDKLEAQTAQELLTTLRIIERNDAGAFSHHLLNAGDEDALMFRFDLYLNWLSTDAQAPVLDDNLDDLSKGDIARKLMYSAIRYPDKTLPVSYARLREWHLLDPVDADETEKNDAICALQRNVNPFVAVPDLVTRLIDEQGVFHYFTLEANSARTLRSGQRTTLSARVNGEQDKQYRYRWYHINPNDPQNTQDRSYLTGADKAQVSFEAPKVNGATAYFIALDVLDAAGNSQQALFTITVTPPAQAFTLTAPGSRHATSGDRVSLTASHTGSAKVTYEWRWVSGPQVTLTQDADGTATFTAPDVQLAQSLVLEVSAQSGKDRLSKRVEVLITPKETQSIATSIALPEVNEKKRGGAVWALLLIMCACTRRFLR